MRKTFSTILLFLVLAFTNQAFALIVHGHRGARARFPENTIPAFSYAINVGVDFLEMDMAVTKDKKIVISHDPFISKVICLDPQGKPIKKEPLIFSLTLDEVQKYDCGSIRNPKFHTQTPVPGTRRPTLEEVFELVENSKDPHAAQIKFNIETKIFSEHPEYTVTPEEFVNLFYAIVKKHHMEGRVVLQSFDFRTLKVMRKIDPSIPLSALVEDHINLIGVQKETGAEIISPDASLLNEKKIKMLHALNVQVHPWTINKPKEWAKLIKWNVDGIISDDPGELINFLRNKGLRP